MSMYKDKYLKYKKKYLDYKNYLFGGAEDIYKPIIPAKKPVKLLCITFNQGELGKRKSNINILSSDRKT